MSRDRDVFGAVYRQDLLALRKIHENGRLTEAIDEDKRTPLMHAVLAELADVNVVEFLLKAGVPANATDGDHGWTALHFSAQSTRPDIAEILLLHGADPNIQDSFGNSCLWRAVYCAKEDLSLVKLLLDHGAMAGLSNSSGVSPIDLARTRGRDDIVELLTRSIA